MGFTDVPSRTFIAVIDVLNTTSSGTEAKYEYWGYRLSLIELVDIHDNRGKTNSHNSFECAGLSSRVPLETAESVIIPEMLCEETQELYVKSGVGKGVNH